MKDIYFSADWHITYDVPIGRKETQAEWIELQVNKIKEIKRIVKNDLLIISGDLIHVGMPKNSEFILNLIVDNLPENVIWITGNHEQKGFSQNLPLTLKKGAAGTLARMRGLTFLNDNDIFSWGDYHFHAFNFGYKKTLEHRALDKSKINIALGHFLSYENEIPFYVKEHAVTAKEILNEFPEYDFICVGDNHTVFSVENKYLSPGSLTRRTIAQKSHKPCIHKYNGKTLDRINLTIDNDVISEEHKLAVELRDERLAKWTEEIKAENESTGDFEEDVKSYFMKNKTRRNTQEVLENMINIVKKES